MRVKRYRLIEYDGDPVYIEEIFAKSLQGNYPTARCLITATEVQEGGLSFEQKIKVSRARSQKPSSWPGRRQPEM